MEFLSQQEPIAELKKLADSGRQSILIEGPLGCGKSYLARQFADYLHIPDCVTIKPNASEIKEAADSCLTLDNPTVLCIENLDMGQPAAAYALLKFLEEPVPNIYIVVTCRNIKFIPDTIISRSTVVSVGPPKGQDLISYAEHVNFGQYHSTKNHLVWRCAQTFSDVNNILHMTPEELAYYDNLKDVCKLSNNVSNTVWAIGHYTHNNAECNLELSIRCIMEILHTTFVMKCGVDCLRELSQARIAKHAILSKFIFNIKYCE